MNPRHRIHAGGLMTALSTDRPPATNSTRVKQVVDVLRESFPNIDPSDVSEIIDALAVDDEVTVGTDSDDRVRVVSVRRMTMPPRHGMSGSSSAEQVSRFLERGLLRPASESGRL